MADEVKTRSYDNSRRLAAARQTRRAVADAALELFVERGYPATTLKAIAARAGVSVQTVYGQFGNKRAVLKTVIDVTVAGDDEPVPLSRRAQADEARRESDPRRVLALVVGGVAEILSRTAGLDRMVRSAAEVDGEAAELWRIGAEQRRRGMAEVVALLARRGQLRHDLSEQEATTRLAALIDPELYRITVVDGGWEPERHRSWLEELAAASLLPR
ncbi:MAG TPA: helix-turn-helix domain-containing protein [Frankiaceae bacterium]|nr:helix-turn-helix domain-containing protein [Frankiaceae bacterium]